MTPDQKSVLTNFSANESFFRAFFESCPIGLNLCRMDGHWVTSNPAFLAIIGYTAEEANADKLTYWALTPNEYAKAEQEQLAQLSSKGAYGPYTKEFIRKDKSRIPVRLNGFLIEIKGQQYIWSMIEDLSDQTRLRNELQRSENFYQSVLDQLPVAVFAKDSAKDWSFVLWNKTAEEILGLKKKDVLGKTDFDLFPRDQCEQFRKNDIQALESKVRFEIEQEPITAPGQPQKWLKTAKIAFNDVTGAPRYLLGISQEITKRKQFETQLTEAVESARKATEAKSQFLSNMSHEIRNPLHAMLSVVGLLADTPMDNSQKRFLQILRESSTRLLDIVNDILDLERIEAGQLAIHNKSECLAPLLNGVADLMSAGARDAKLDFVREIQIPTDLAVQTDSGVIHQILNNIIGNAIKFTPPGGIIEFRARWSSDILAMEVRDTGIGIAKDKLAHVFEPFEQGDSSIRKKYGGTGLGLAIVRKLISRLNGKIEFESDLGKGTIVKMSLPMTKAISPFPCADNPLSNKQSAEDQSSGTTRLNVMFADDSVDNQVLVTEFLRKHPYDLSVYDDGRAALNAFKTSRPDIILLDIGMPELDGNEAIRSIRQMEKELGWPRTPAIALTGYATPADVEKSKAAGFDAHLSKPFSAAQLLGVIKQARVSH